MSRPRAHVNMFGVPLLPHLEASATTKSPNGAVEGGNARLNFFRMRHEVAQQIMVRHMDTFDRPRYIVPAGLAQTSSHLYP